MKFKSFLNTRLMNEASEGGDAGASSESGMSAQSAFSASSNVGIGDNDDDAFKNAGLDPAKYGLGKADPVENQEEESQGGDEDEEAGQSDDEKSFLKLVNSLGLIHSEKPFEVGNKDELKNLLQMGKDYTLKTQSLSEDRKAFDLDKSQAEEYIQQRVEEVSKSQKDFEQKFQELEQWMFTLDQLKTEAPDIFEEVQRAHSGTQKQYSNPILTKQLAEFKSQLDQVTKGLEQRENKLVLDGFDSEFAKAAHLEQSLKELGITVSKEDVKKEWANTGLGAEQVIGMLYGAKLMQAQASKAKVEQTKQKVNAKPAGGASSSRTGTKGKAIDPKLKGLDFAKALWDRHTN